jgi:hypothetical protein
MNPGLAPGVKQREMNTMIMRYTAPVVIMPAGQYVTHRCPMRVNHPCIFIHSVIFSGLPFYCAGWEYGWKQEPGKTVPHPILIARIRIHEKRF